MYVNAHCGERLRGHDLREVGNSSGDRGDIWLGWAAPAGWIVDGFVIFLLLFRWQ